MLESQPITMPGVRVWSLLSGSTHFGRILRVAVATLVSTTIAYVAFSDVGIAVRTASSSYAYSQDFLQEYVLARAVADGSNPYLPLRSLALHYFGDVSGPVLDHPTPHAPPVGILFLPLALLDYRAAANVWLIVQCLCVVASAYLLLGCNEPRPRFWAVAAITISMLAWPSVESNLYWGQLMLALLALLAAARLAAKNNRPGLAGMLTGIAILVKPTPWPLLLVFALRRDWRALRAALATITVGYIVAGWVMGWDSLVTYVTKVLPLVNLIYQRDSFNLSVWTIGWRIFAGTRWSSYGATVLTGITARPLMTSPTAGFLVSAGLPILILLASCLAVCVLRDREQASCLMICTSVLISPISWDHYLVLVAMPATVVVQLLATRGFPIVATTIVAACGSILAIPIAGWAVLAVVLSGMPIPGPEADLIANPNLLNIPFGPGILLCLPTLAVGALGLCMFVFGARTRWLTLDW